MTDESITDKTSSDLTLDKNPMPYLDAAVVENKKEKIMDYHSTMHESCDCHKKEKDHRSNDENKSLSKSYVYVIGKIAHRFPNKSLEMELAQVIGNKPGAETRGLSQEETVYQALIDPNNRYIARQLCYILNVEYLETYLLVPSDPLDIEKLVKAVKPSPNLGDIDVVIGRKGPIAPPEMCNGLMLPIVMVDQIYSFDRETLIKAIPRQTDMSDDQFTRSSNALFDRIIQLADNAGSTDEHRALNYLAVRYDKIYERTQLMQDENYSFTGIEVHLSRLSGVRKVLDVIFFYQNRQTLAVSKWFVRVDVTDEFPFLVSPVQEYYER
ncbi:MAG: hypothetical protein P0116_15020 [Candidatus Nitrosocosmicus sp.]|nr:hypothetical protein [Candidatus Nitrosocosmicus sp.]